MTTMNPETAEPTDTQLLSEIVDLDSGLPVDIDAFIRRELGQVMQARHRMSLRYRQDPATPWLICAFCGGSVQLVSMMDRRFYFRHMPDQEDRGCPVNTRGRFSPDQILAMKYNGTKESVPHLRLKQIIRDSVLTDPSFGEPKVEHVWRSTGVSERSAWRKPDVQVAWGNHRLAFEVQLSTTFLSVIVGRRDFYRAENGSLIWIFESFESKELDDVIAFLLPRLATRLGGR